MNYETCTEIEIALSKHYGIRSHHIVPNISWGLWIHECDMLVVTKNGFATEIEIKISKADLKKDKEKQHGHEDKRIKNFYFAIPRKIPVEYAYEHIPKRAGLIVVNESGKCTVERPATPRKDAKKLTNEEIHQVLRLGNMRQWTLKTNLVKNRQQYKQLKENHEALQSKYDKLLAQSNGSLQEQYDASLVVIKELLPTVDLLQASMPPEIQDPKKWLRELVKNYSNKDALKI